jgi:hypothetical protein
VHPGHTTQTSNAPVPCLLHPAGARAAPAHGKPLAAHPAPPPLLARFLCALGLTGAYCFCTALCGLSGVKRDRRATLAAYILLMAALVLAQAAATLLLLSDNTWRERIPGEPRMPVPPRAGWELLRWRGAGSRSLVRDHG